MDREAKNRRRRSCWETARARQAHARRNGASRQKARLIFLMALLAMLPSAPTTVRRPPPPGEGGPDRPRNDYERGAAASPIRPPRGRPSLRKLMRDLHRPGGKAAAREILLARIPDPELRCWIGDRIDEGRLSELAMHVRPDLPEQAIFARWQGASIADAESETDDHDPNRKGPGGHRPGGR